MLLALRDGLKDYPAHVVREVSFTGFFETARMQKPPARASQTPEDVVDTALRGLKHGRSHIISGLPNYLMVQAERLVPRSLIARVAGMVLRNALKE